MTITPGTTAGTTSVTVKENRGNKTVKVDITVEACYSIEKNGNKTYYQTLYDATEAATDGDTINLEEDVEDNVVTTITKDITINLQNNTIDTIGEESKDAWITIDEGASLTVLGPGSINMDITEGRSCDVFRNLGGLHLADATVTQRTSLRRLCDTKLRQLDGRVWINTRLESGGLQSSFRYRYINSDAHLRRLTR